MRIPTFGKIVRTPDRISDLVRTARQMKAFNWPREAKEQARHEDGTDGNIGAAPEQFWLGPNDIFLNNEACPVLVYRGAIDTGSLSDPALSVEALFERNGWPVVWRNEVFLFHHYHSTAHAALAVVSGSATLVLGGPGGEQIQIRVGDVILFPVGTARCRLGATMDFAVIGGCLRGQQPDICQAAPTPDAQAQMAQLPAPQSDPVFGSHGPVMALWGAPMHRQVPK